MVDELIWTSGHELASMIRRKEVSPVEVVRAVLERAEEVDPQVNAFVTLTPELAMQQARAAEQAVVEGRDDLPALHGVPITVKDLTDTAGVRTTYGSVMYEDHVPDQDSLTWARLKAAGAILIGKTTTPEFGALGVTESKLTGTTSTPWDVTRTSGGSSGGAAAAAAAGVAPLAWGSDGGGSIRVPASSCGVVGFKASRGRLPHRGNVEPDSTDGPLARRIVDIAMMLDATAGPHLEDPFSLPATDESYVAAALAPANLAGLRIAYSPDLGQPGPIDSETHRVVAQAAQSLAAAGAQVDEVTLALPNAEEFFVAFWSPGYVEVDDLLRAGGHEVWPLIREMADQGRLRTGNQISAAIGADKTAIFLEFTRTLATYDVIIAPTTPVPAFPHCGDKGGVDEVDGSPTRHPGLHFHSLTELPSHAGLPAVSVPCGFTSSGLPVGLQIIGRPHADASLISVAAAFEQLAPQWQHHPLVR